MGEEKLIELWTARIKEIRKIIEYILLFDIFQSSSFVALLSSTPSKFSAEALAFASAISKSFLFKKMLGVAGSVPNGAVIHMLAIHFSPLLTSQPPCRLKWSSSPIQPSVVLTKWLYHNTAFPFCGLTRRLAILQPCDRLYLSLVVLPCCLTVCVCFFK